MAINTALTDRLGLEHPIVLAPMGQIAGGHLAATVSNAGGLGLVGGGYGDHDWLRRELALARATARRPWGVGLITWHATEAAVTLALSFKPDVVLLSFGDITPYAPMIKAAGCALLCQVQDVDMARAAVDAGADIIVAQGTEAGGHGATRATLPLVPTVVDAVAPVPVVAAGGIADGRGLAAALMLGACGVMIGTRFIATDESLAPEAARQRVVASRAADTVRTTVFDIIRHYSWPVPFTGRALRNAFADRWHDREAELVATLATEAAVYQRAAAEADFDTAVIFAGEAVELTRAITPAAEVVRQIGIEAEACLREGAFRCG